MSGKVSWSLPESTLGLSNIDEFSAKQTHSYYMVSDPDLSCIVDEMKEMVAEATCNMSTLIGVAHVTRYMLIRVLTKVALWGRLFLQPR